jgi:hypothetical protein
MFARLEIFVSAAMPNSIAMESAPDEMAVRALIALTATMLFYWRLFCYPIHLSYFARVFFTVVG